MEEAVQWAKRCPDPMPGEDAELELRPVFEAEDFGEEFTPELRAQEDRLSSGDRAAAGPGVAATAKGYRYDSGISTGGARRPAPGGN
jgi:hypothetical protein